jgi:hypothetical protein
MSVFSGFFGFFAINMFVFLENSLRFMSVVSVSLFVFHLEVRGRKDAGSFERLIKVETM